jgi:hypothetical protein
MIGVETQRPACRPGYDVWVVDSTPVDCRRSRQTANRSELAGWAS